MSKSVISDGKKVLKNILIAIVTSVLGAGAIYFLGFNNAPKLTDEEKEEVTVEAWKSYASVENIYIKNAISRVQDAIQYHEFSELHKQSDEESVKYRTKVTELLATTGVDKALVKLFKEKLNTETKCAMLSGNFYDALQLMKKNNSNWTDEELSKQTEQRSQQFVAKLRGELDKSASETSQLADNYSEKYARTFDVSDFLILNRIAKNSLFDITIKPVSTIPVKPMDGGGGDIIVDDDVAVQITDQYLEGKWKQNENVIEFKKDHSITWDDRTTKKIYKGQWELVRDVLIIRIKNHPVSGGDGSGTFVVTDVMTKTFTMQLTDLTKDYYHLERI